MLCLFINAYLVYVNILISATNSKSHSHIIGEMFYFSDEMFFNVDMQRYHAARRYKVYQTLGHLS